MARNPKPAIGLVMLSDTKILGMATGRSLDAQRIGDLSHKPPGIDDDVIFRFDESC